MQIIVRTDRLLQDEGHIRVRVSWYAMTGTGYQDGEVMTVSVPSDATTMRDALADACRAVLATLAVTSQTGSGASS